MLDRLTELSGTLAGLLWNSPLTLIALLGTGLYLTIRLGVVQVRAFPHAIQLLRGRYKSADDTGEVSQVQALATVLSATVGTGNIAGVATAIALGGPGALLWMWVSAFLGMATNFTACTLALKYREVDPDGVVSGGPMYTLANGLNMRKTAILFASFAMIASFGIGNMVQANSVMDGLSYLRPELKQHAWLVGSGMAVVVGLVIIGGVRRIAKVATLLVPLMALIYMGGALIVLSAKVTAIPAAFVHIFNSALNPWAVGGAAVGEAIRWGVARGLFSNEAGLGSSPMAFAALRTNEPVRAGFVAMMSPFIDTIVVCTVTGLVIIVTGSVETRPPDAEGAAFTAYAFSQVLGVYGGWIVGVGLTLFAFSTTIAWSYYGDRCARFLFGERAVLPYRIAYTILFAVGAAVPLKLVWNIADTMNILMALPNLVSVLLLAGVAGRLYADYREKHPL